MPVNSSAGLRENSFNELNILFEVSNIVFSKTSISEFTYSNQLNKPPYGNFVLKDNGQLDEQGLQSGTFGFLYFTNSSDTDQLKRMILPIYIEYVEVIDKIDLFTYYQIKWVAGSLNQLNVRQNDIIAQSNSTDALRKIFELRELQLQPHAGIRPSDTMNWLVVNQNMWEQLESISSRSFIPNDLIYWCWDDVDSQFKISTYKTEFTKADTTLLVRDFDSLTNTSDAVQFTEKGNVGIWKYTNYKKFNSLGSSYKNLFPNVSFLGIPSGIIKSGGIKRDNFISLLKSLQDTKIEEILSVTGINSRDAVFGDLILRKHSINGHDLYSFADIYRKYKEETYAKTFICQLYNTVGPKLGSCVSVLNVFNTSEGNLDTDLKFSDKYIIKRKLIQYDGKATNKIGRTFDAATNYVTTLFLVSDNYGNGDEHINRLLDKIK